MRYKSIALLPSLMIGSSFGQLIVIIIATRCVFWHILVYSSGLFAAQIPPTDNYLWVIGVVFGGLLLILVIIWFFLFIYYSCKRAPRRYAKTGFLPPAQQHFDAVHPPFSSAVSDHYIGFMIDFIPQITLLT